MDQITTPSRHANRTKRACWRRGHKGSRQKADLYRRSKGKSKTTEKRLPAPKRENPLLIASNICTLPAASESLGQRTWGKTSKNRNSRRSSIRPHHHRNRRTLLVLLHSSSSSSNRCVISSSCPSGKQRPDDWQALLVCRKLLSHLMLSQVPEF